MYIRRGTIDLLVRVSANSILLGPTKLKNHLYHFIFFVAPNIDISLDLMNPQKSFTYQNLQDLTARMVSKPADEAIFLKIITGN